MAILYSSKKRGGGNLLGTGLRASQCSRPALRLHCKSSWVATCNVPLLCGCDRRQLGLVWRASTNTGCFLVGCSLCWQGRTRLRKTCYHSCNTGSVRESTRFWYFENFGQRRVTFFACEMKFSMVMTVGREVVACQSSAHCFAPSFDHSLASE